MIISPTGTQSVGQAAIAAGAVVVSSHAGQFNKALVTVTTTAAQAITIFDNASAGSGTIIGIIPGGTAAGTIFAYDIPVVLGITIGQNAALAAGQITMVFA